MDGMSLFVKDEQEGGWRSADADSISMISRSPLQRPTNPIPTKAPLPPNGAL